MIMNKFHPLTITSIASLTADAVAISFEVGNNALFQFEAGQYITIKKDINDLKYKPGFYNQMIAFQKLLETGILEHPAQDLKEISKTFNLVKEIINAK